MTFLISETFTDSLARLTGEEQKAVKTTAFDLQRSTNHSLLATPHSPGNSSLPSTSESRYDHHSLYRQPD